MSITGNLTLAGAWTQTGAHAVNLTTSGTTTLTLPTGAANVEVIASLNTSWTQGDTLYYDGSDWVVLAVGSVGQVITSDGTDVSWGVISTGNASNLSQGCTLDDGGALDAILAFTTQTSSAPTLTIPNFAGASQTFAFLNLAQTWLQAQSFYYGKFLIGDDDNSHYLTINWEESEVTAARALDLKVNGGTRIIDLTGNLVLAANLTTTTGAVTLAGQAGGSSVTLPSTGTMAVVGGALGAAGITGGTAIELTDLSVRDDSVAFDLNIHSASTGMDADRTLTFDVLNANKAVKLGGDLTTIGAFTTTTGAVTLAGDAGGSSVSVPASGTLMNTTGALDAGSCLNLTALGVADNSGSGSYEMQIVCSSTYTAADHTLTFVPGDANRQITIGADVSFATALSVTTGAVTLVGDAGGSSITFPSSGTAATLAGTETLTEKTFDCNASGNTLTNIDGAELASVTIPTTETAVNSVPVIFWCHLDNEVAAVKMSDSMPFAVVVIDAWSINTTAHGGTWKIQNDTPADITDVVTTAATDKEIDRITTIDDAQWAIAAAADMYVDASAVLDAYIFVECLRATA